MRALDKQISGEISVFDAKYFQDCALESNAPLQPVSQSMHVLNRVIEPEKRNRITLLALSLPLMRGSLTHKSYPVPGTSMFGMEVPGPHNGALRARPA